MIKIIIFFISIISFSLFASSGRLDPHGTFNSTEFNGPIKSGSSCLVCHIQGEGKVRFYKNIITKCYGCHGKSPHSGLAEHLGKDLSKLGIGLKGKIDCLSCHRPHRFTSKKSEKMADSNSIRKSFLYSKRDFTLSKSSKEVRSSFPMLSKSCTDCHKSID